MKKTLFFIAAGILVVVFSCTKNNNNFSATCNGTKSFAADVNPIVQAYCATAGCHATNGNGPGAITNHSQVFNNRSAIRTAVANGSMPQNSSLSEDQKNAIICWIDSGAPNN